MMPFRIRGLSLALIAIFALAAGLAARPGPALGQTPMLPIDAGTTYVSGQDWHFNTDLHVGSGPWQRVLVTNAPPCWQGDTPPWAGSAHAGAIYWYANLQPLTTQSPYSIMGADLVNQRGSGMWGYALVTTTDGDKPVTHIDASIWGVGQYFSDNKLTVCLQ